MGFGDPTVKVRKPQGQRSCAGGRLCRARKNSQVPKSTDKSPGSLSDWARAKKTKNIWRFSGQIVPLILEIHEIFTLQTLFVLEPGLNYNFLGHRHLWLLGLLWPLERERNEEREGEGGKETDIKIAQPRLYFSFGFTGN